MSTVSVPQFGTYEGTIDTINVGALDALSLRIPLFHAHRRGQKIDQDIALVYSDDLAHYLSTSLSYRVTGGWTLTQGEGYQNGISILETTYPCQLPNNPTEGPGSVTSAQYFYTDERGVQSTFGTLLSDCMKYSGFPTWSNTLSNVPATNGTGVVLTTANGNTATVEDIHGITYQSTYQSPGYSVKDSNGNTGQAVGPAGIACPYGGAPTGVPGLKCASG